MKHTFTVKPRQKAHKKVISAVTFEISSKNLPKHPRQCRSPKQPSQTQPRNLRSTTWLTRQLAMQSLTALRKHTSMHNPTNVETIASTFSKDVPADARLDKLCDNRLVNQMAFMMEVPGRSAQLAVLSCPFPTTKGTDAVFAGSLGDSMDILCPITIRMRDVKGHVVTIASIKSIPTRLKLAISTTDPLAEEAPDPVPINENAGDEQNEILVPPPPGPDRLHLEITDPTDAPCIIMIPKIFSLSGGHSIP